MTDNIKQLYLDFEAYERVAEPHKRERASAWRTAIGLQDVDGLKVSDYLKETAVRHIEGDITIDDVREQLKSYYVNKTTHDEDDVEKEEADRVAANIAKLLSEKSFSFTALEFLNIHRHLFEGVFKHAGEIRPYDINKKEWILQGDTVVYGRAADIMMALRYDIQREKGFLVKFFRNLMLGEQNVLKNRYMLIGYSDINNGSIDTHTSTHTSSSGQLGVLSENIKRLILAIGSEEKSVKEMMEIVGLKNRPNFFEHSLTPAIQKGLVKMKYPNSPRHPRQKYLLTVKGFAMYDECKS